MASTTSSPLPSEVGSYKLLNAHTLPHAPITVAKWQSSASGLSVVWVDVPGPIVQGYFTVATEIFDDSGRPHTLEHLVFMGSEKYPYKGVLDTLANRMFANGTNAWTETTDTTYTVDTAGAEGFLSILPVYADHILYPTLTDAAFTTEVYNINGRGEDAGVVYSEMQGCENDSGNILQLALQRTFYGPENALRSETGGLMAALRVLKAQDIRSYHASQYVPPNTTLIVLGRSVDPRALLETLEAGVEPSIAAHGAARGPRPPGWRRPFVETATAAHPPRLAADETIAVPFPSTEEDSGEILLAWVGPAYRDFTADAALDALFTYLADGPVSPLYAAFVEIADPLCTDLSFYASVEDPAILQLSAGGVGAAELATLGPKLRACLAELADADFDVARMRNVLERARLQTLDDVETSPMNAFATPLVGDFLYGDPAGAHFPALFDTAVYARLSLWSADEWKALLRRFLVDNACATFVGTPSAELAAQLEKDSRERVQANVAKYGEDGLAKLAQQLKDAQAANDREIPPEMMAGFAVPDVTKIEWIAVESARSEGVAARDGKGVGEARGKVQEYIERDGAKLPLFVQYDHIDSNFVTITLHLFVDDKSVAEGSSLRSLIPIFADAFFSLPVVRADGTRLEYEDVVKQLQADTVSYSIDVGSPLDEDITVSIKAPLEKYGTAVQWLGDLVFGAEFDVERLKISTKKAIQNLPQEKRDGNAVAGAAFKKLLVIEDSTYMSCNLLRRIEFLPRLLELLEKESESAVAQFKALRDALVNPRLMRVNVVGNILGLDAPAKTWLDRFRATEFFDRSELRPVVLGQAKLSELGRAPARKLVVYGVPAIESSFAYHVARGPDAFTHPDLPALIVARSVLTAMEGFLWKFIRGAGLAYGANLQQDVELGVLYYSVYRSPDAFKAFAAARDLIQQLVARKIELTEFTLESAKSSLAYSTASRESTGAEAAVISFNNQVLFGLPADHGRRVLAATKDVTVDDALRVIDKWIAPIFDASTSVAGVATGLAKMDDMVGEFKKSGFDVEVHSFQPDEDEDDEMASDSESWSEVSSVVSGGRV